MGSRDFRKHEIKKPKKGEKKPAVKLFEAELPVEVIKKVKKEQFPEEG